jgi:hypothetical protein
VGTAVDGPVQPGENYLVTGSYQPNDPDALSYPSFDPQTYEQSDDDAASSMERTFTAGGIKFGATDKPLSRGRD